jgi:WD40 repeat protein
MAEATLNEPVERYAAFMSYSHALDGQLAPALQTSLEHFGRVWYRRRALRIFRDTTNLGATPHLWGSIEEALGWSEWFILLASPESARSHWVQREVDWWLTNRSATHLIVAVTAGSVAWDYVTGGVDEEQTDALPPAFAAHGLAEPLWVDLRSLRAAEPTDPGYQSAVVDIAATLHGRSKDDLVGEHIRQYRKRRRSIALAGLALVLLTLTSVITAGVAVDQRSQANGQARIATARLLMTQAQDAVATDPQTAMQLAEAAWHINPSPENNSLLAQVVRSNMFTGRLIGHTDAVRSVSFSPDGHTLATGSADQSVILWDLTEPARPRRIGEPLTGHASAVSSVSFSPDGRTLATGSGDQSVILWDLTEPARPRRIGQPLTGYLGWVYSVSFSPDGRTLATSSGDKGEVDLWDVTDLPRPRWIGSPLTGYTGQVSFVSFSPDGRTLATSSRNSTVDLWDVTNMTQLKTRGLRVFENATSAAFSRDRPTLAVSSLDGSVTVWDVSDPRSPQQLGQPIIGQTRPSPKVWLGNREGRSYQSVTALSVNGDAVAVSNGDKLVSLWDISDPGHQKRIGQSLAGHSNVVSSMAFAPDMQTFVTGSDDGTVVLWDLIDRTRPERIGQPFKEDRRTLLPEVSLPSFVASIAFAPSGQVLATGNYAGGATLWDLSNLSRPQPVGEPIAMQASLVMFSPVRNTLATMVAGKPVFHDLATPSNPKRIERFGLDETKASVDVNEAMAFTSDGRLLAVSSGSIGDGLSLWDMTDPERAQRIGLIDQSLVGVKSMAFAPEGRTLATGFVDGTMILWDLTRPEQPQRIAEMGTENSFSVNSLAFSPDGRTLAAASEDSTIVLWDMTNPVEPQPIGQPLAGHTNALMSIALSADGYTLAVASADNTATLWDLTNLLRPQRIGQPLTGHTDAVHSVAFTSEGRTLATASSDGVILWDLTDLISAREHALQLACTRSGGGFDRHQWERFVKVLPYENSCATA